MWGNARDFIYLRQTGQCNVKQQTRGGGGGGGGGDCCGFYQLAVPAGWEVIAGNCWMKNQNLRCFPGLGAMITNDWCITTRHCHSTLEIKGDLKKISSVFVILQFHI